MDRKTFLSRIAHASPSRRAFLAMSGAAAMAAATAPPRHVLAQSASADIPESWDRVRSLFTLSENTIHMSAMLLASHPAPVREAIEAHRQALDADPVEYLEENNNPLTEAVLQAAGEYIGVDPSQIALTDSTTMGVGLVYNGLKLRQGDDILTTEEDYYVTHESLRLSAEKAGAGLRKIKLFQAINKVTEDEIVGNIIAALLPSTRLVALTWVHSSTGLKIPVAAISAALSEVNQNRDEQDHVLLGVDAVHGFGIEDFSFEKLGCDFLMAGCHKWLFGPRGTGIVALSRKGLAALRPTIPSFIDNGVFAAWLDGLDAPSEPNNGARMTPGGFKPFEHRWALAPAFELHRRIGRERVAARTHELAAALKRALASIGGVHVLTPGATRLSAGIVSFDVEGSSPERVVSDLRQRRIVASVSPYATPHARLTPSIRNTEAEIEKVAAALREVV